MLVGEREREKMMKIAVVLLSTEQIIQHASDDDDDDDDNTPLRTIHLSPETVPKRTRVCRKQ